MRPIVAAFLCLFLLTILAVHCSASDQQEMVGAAKEAAKTATARKARVDSGGFIWDWLVLGPLHTAGLTMDLAHGEQTIRPNHGNKFFACGDRATWQLVQSDTPTIDLKAAFPRYKAHVWPGGYPACAYAHVYISSSMSDCKIEVDGKFGRYEAYLNGQRLPKDGTASLFNGNPLQPGVNSLLLKFYGTQTKGHDWSFTCRILGVDGEPLKGQEYFVNNPEQDPPDLKARNRDDFKPGQAPSDRIRVGIAPGNCPTPMYIWYEDQSVTPQLTFSTRTDQQMKTLFGNVEWAPSEEEIKVRAFVEVQDTWGEQAYTDTHVFTITPDKPVHLPLEMGQLKRGHYVIRVRLERQGGGWLLNTACQWGQNPRRLPAIPMQLAVVSRELNETPAKTSKLGASFYWAAANNQAMTDQRMLQCQIMGVKFHISMRSWTWAGPDLETLQNKPPEQWEWNPGPDLLIESAKKHGITLVGDLDGWWPVHGSPAASWSNHKAAKDDAVVSFYVESANWQLIGRYDEKVTEDLVRKYTHAVVSRYKDRIRFWKFHNEANLFRDRGFTPKFYTHLLKIASQAAKEADPDCIIINASLSGSDSSYLGKMLSLGAAKYFDIVDIHNYSWGHHGGRTMLTAPIHSLLSKRGIDKPIIIGETGHFRYYPANGVLGQLRQSVKWYTYSKTLAWMDKICFGVEGPAMWTLSSGLQAPYPGYLGLRTASLAIDGARFVDKFPSKHTEGWVFQKGDQFITVLWSNGQNETFRFDQDLTVCDLLDRRSSLPGGQTITTSLNPLILTSGKQLKPTVVETSE